MFSHFGYEAASNQCLVNNVDDIARKNGPEQKRQSHVHWDLHERALLHFFKVSNFRQTSTGRWVRVGSGAAVAGRRMAQPVYPQLRKCPCVPAFALRAKYGGDAYFAAS